MTPAFLLCPQNGWSPRGPRFPRALIHAPLPAFAGLRLPGARRPTCRRLTAGGRRTVGQSPPPPPQRRLQPSSRRAGQRLPGKRRQNSHGATGLLFKKGSDVTVWWQESHPASFPSSHNNPAPENRPLGAGRQRAPRGRERKPQGLGRTHTGWKQPAPQACSSVPLTSADTQISVRPETPRYRPFRSHPCWSKADSA